METNWGFERRIVQRRRGRAEQMHNRKTDRERERETRRHMIILPPSLAILGSDPGFAKHYTGELGKHAAQRFGRIFFLQPSQSRTHEGREGVKTTVNISRVNDV